MSRSVVGITFLLLFAAIQGLRDALFGSIFQSVSFLLVALLAAGTSTTVFVGYSMIRCPGEMRKILASPGALIALNATTAGAWLSYFYGLRHLEPAVVATIYSGARPLAVLAMQHVGVPLAQTKRGRVETISYIGAGVALLALLVVVLTNRSGVSATNLVIEITALAAVILGGAMIAVSHLIARWFNDHDVSASCMVGVRFLLTLAIAAGAELMLGSDAMRPELVNIPALAGMAFVLITAPTLLLQLGVARTSPLAVNVFRALGPVFVFVVQQLDNRLQFSGATLTCILAFCAFMIAASLMRARNEIVGTKTSAME